MRFDRSSACGSYPRACRAAWWVAWKLAVGGLAVGEITTEELVGEPTGEAGSLRTDRILSGNPRAPTLSGQQNSSNAQPVRIFRAYKMCVQSKSTNLASRRSNDLCHLGEHTALQPVRFLHSLVETLLIVSSVFKHQAILRTVTERARESLKQTLSLGTAQTLWSHNLVFTVWIFLIFSLSLSLAQHLSLSF